MNRRMNPESPGPIHWPQIWRSLRASSRCKPVSGAHWMRDKIEWDVDTGYCLDRFSTLAELSTETERRKAEYEEA